MLTSRHRQAYQRVRGPDVYDVLTWLLLSFGTTLTLLAVAGVGWVVWLGVSEAVRIGLPLGGGR
ncbi:MAG: hypothetical protein NUW22_15915 [Acidobacteria bacterium]|nr:hypothetical protein [Acidobacteriota bacterium]